MNVHHALKRFDVEHPPSLAELEAISPIRKARLKSILNLFKNENVVRERDDRLRQSQVLEYAEARVCRWDRIVSDFGQTDRDWSTCGHCDTCDSTAL